MPQPCVAAQCGPYSCVCVLDPQDQCSNSGVPGTESLLESEEGQLEAVSIPQESVLSSSMAQRDVREEMPEIPEAEARKEEPWSPPEPSESSRGAALPNFQVGGSTASGAANPPRLPLPGPPPPANRVWPWPPVPVPRECAGARRQAARDAFNVQELIFGDAMARRDFSDPSVEDIGQLLSDEAAKLLGWGRGNFKSQLRDLQGLLREVEGREWEDSELNWVLRLAIRRQEGPALLRPSCLRYALLARHGFRSLCFPELQLVALLRVRRGAGKEGLSALQAVDRRELQRLMEELNGRLPVSSEEVDAVVEEALLISGGSDIRRGDLMRSLGAWYANVQRNDSPPAVFLHAWASALLHGREYHTTLIEKLRQLLPFVLRALRRQRQAQDAGSAASARLLSGPLQRWLQMCWSAGVVVSLLLGLAIPGCLFAWALYMGTAHGDDACPHDLDGLLTWFGIVGLAFLFVGCADAGSDHTSWIGLALRTVLLLFPWVGADWTFHLTSDEQRTCGRTLVYASMWLWTILLLLELFGACALCWRAAVFAEHELSLQHLAIRGVEHPEDGTP